MLFNSWKILVISILIEKHFIFKQGVVEAWCQIDGFDARKGELSELSSIQEEYYRDPEELNLASLQDDNREGKTICKERDQSFKDAQNNFNREYISHSNGYRGRSQRDAVELLHATNVKDQKIKGKQKIQIYELKQNEINEKSIRELIGSVKENKIAQCSAEEYESVEKWVNMALAREHEHFMKASMVSNLLKSNIKGTVNGEPTSPLDLNEDSKLLNNLIKKRQIDGSSNLQFEKGTQMFNMTPGNRINPHVSIFSNLVFEGGTVLLDQIMNRNINNSRKLENQFIPQDSYTKSVMKEFPIVSRFLSPKPLITKNNSQNIPSSVDLVKNEKLPESVIELISPSRLGISKDIEQAKSYDFNANLDKSIVGVVYGNSSEKPVIEIRNSTGDNFTGQTPIGFIYLQSMPVGESLYLQKVQGKNGTDQDKDKDDAITIMINPKTLKNKILHAEFIKKTENKTPDTLVIDLMPLNDTKKSFQDNNESAKTNFLTLKNNIMESKLPNIHDHSLLIEKHVVEPRHRRDLEYPDNDYNQYFVSDVNLNELVSDSIQNKGTVYATFQQKDAKVANKILSSKFMIVDGKNLQPKKGSNFAYEGFSAVTVQPTTDSSNSEEPQTSPTTPDMNTFKELEEGLKDSWQINYQDFYNENPKSIRTEYSTLSMGALTTVSSNDATAKLKDKKRAAMFRYKNIPPIIMMYPESGEQNNKESCDLVSSLKDELYLDGEPSIAARIANKKMENKLLEGFISSIIANYSRDSSVSSTKNYSDKKSEEGEAIINLIKELVNKKGKENIDHMDFQPVIVPQESIGTFAGCKDYEKLGPFSEDIIKTILQQDSVQLFKTELKK